MNTDAMRSYRVCPQLYLYQTSYFPYYSLSRSWSFSSSSCSISFSSFASTSSTLLIVFLPYSQVLSEDESGICRGLIFDGSTTARARGDQHGQYSLISITKNRLLRLFDCVFLQSQTLGFNTKIDLPQEIISWSHEICALDFFHYYFENYFGANICPCVILKLR